MSTESNDPTGSEPTSDPGYTPDPGPSAPPPATPPPPPPAAEPPPSYQSSAPPTAAPAVDLASIPRSVMISLGGSIVLLISVFFSWYSFAGLTASGWSATDVAKLVFLLALVAGAAWVIDLFVPTVQIPYPAWMIAGAAGGLAIVLVLFRMASKPGGAFSGALSLSWGIFLALIAAIAVVVGAYLRMNETSS